MMANTVPRGVLYNNIADISPRKVHVGELEEIGAWWGVAEQLVNFSVAQAETRRLGRVICKLALK